MSAIGRSSSLNTSQKLAAVMGHKRASLSEKPTENEDQERLREEYERLLRQLDKKPPESPQPGGIPVKPENSARRRS